MRGTGSMDGGVLAVHGTGDVDGGGVGHVKEGCWQCIPLAMWMGGVLAVRATGNVDGGGAGRTGRVNG